MGELDEAIASQRRVVDLEPRSAAALSALLYTLHYCPDYNAAALAEEHRKWEAQFGQMLAAHARPHANALTTNRRIKVGYVSPGFRDHTVPRFIEAALSHHDRGRFDVIPYSDVVREDAITARLRSMGLLWRDIHGLGHDVVARIVRRDAIDILVDLRAAVDDVAGRGAGRRIWRRRRERPGKPRAPMGRWGCPWR